jgi:hypothetical protein
MNMSGNGPAITVQDMLDRQKLFTMDQGIQVLQSTEPLAFRDLTTGPHVRFKVGDENKESLWSDDMLQMHGTEKVPVYLSLSHGENDSTEYQLTLDAFLESLKQFGLGFKYAVKCPNFLIEDQLNYWYRTGLDNRDLKLMLVGDDNVAAALTRATINPFSNLELVERAVTAIQTRYPDAEIFFDATKMAHSLHQTFTQLVIPDLTRQMTGTGESDDLWWGGVQFRNSLVGDGQTGIEGFLYRMLCTNGMIDTGPTAAGWSRKTGGQDPEDVYRWAQQAVDGVLGGLESSFDAVQSTADERIDGDVAQTIRDVFSEHRIPGPLQRGVLDELVDNDDLTMYGLMNAVTAAANGEISSAHQQLLMRTGGDVARHADRCRECRRILPDGVQPSAEDHAEHTH